VKEAISYLKFLEMGNRECDKCQSPASHAGDNGTVSLWRWKEGYSYERLRTPKRIESMIQRLPRMQFLFSYSMTWWGQSRNQTWSDRPDTLRIPTAGCHFDKMQNVIDFLSFKFPRTIKIFYKLLQSEKNYTFYLVVSLTMTHVIFFLASYAIISDMTCACQEWR
jgi:hypothetical protein